MRRRHPEITAVRAVALGIVLAAWPALPAVLLPGDAPSGVASSLTGLLRHLAPGSGVARAQVVQVDQPAVCFQCHADIEAQEEKAHVHAAFASGECSNCHNPHAASHAALLNEDKGQLCLSCHEDVKTEAAKASPHRPVVSGDCGACHEAHAADYDHLLKQKGSDLCRSCHAEAKDWTARPVVHAPVRNGQCLRCHAPHGSGNEALLTAGVPDLCFQCHRRDGPFAAAHKGQAMARANCAACHDPHSSSVPSLLRENQHAPFAAGNCKSCHPGGTGPDAYAVQKPPAELCETCHRSIAELAGKEFHRHIDDPRSCLNCHQPHAANPDFLLSAEQPVLCMRCHFNKTDKKPKSEFITHGGMDCTNCHEPHGSDNPRYLKATTSDLCLGCHESAHRASHPVGSGVIDPRTGEPVTCISCHQLHGADFPKYLPLDPGGPLCIQCHKR